MSVPSPPAPNALRSLSPLASDERPVSPKPEPSLLNPEQLYEMFCKDFKLPVQPPQITPTEVHRYGLVVPRNLELHSKPEHRPFAVFLMKERKYLDDPPSSPEEDYDYRGIEVVFEH